MFTALIFAADVTATIVVAGQSVVKTGGMNALRVANLDATNFAKIGFGADAATAEAAAATGIAIDAGKVEVLSIPNSARYFSYLGDTGSVVLNIQQGTA